MSWLWTIVPVEQVLENREETSPRFREIEYDGITMMVEPMADGMGRVERLLSGNPADFLRPELQPGSLVPLVRGR